MSTQPGLRERKKQQTRRLIADTARRLFVERGFDAVTIAEVAREADVSEGTVFNYFPSKEDLFYSGMESFEAALLDAVCERPQGESALAAFRRFVLEQSSAVPDRAELIETAARIVEASPALRARERQIVAGYTDALAELLARETRARPGDIEPVVAATALMGAQQALVAYTRSSVLAGLRGRTLLSRVKAQAGRAFACLDAGLGDYAVKR